MKMGDRGQLVNHESSAAKHLSLPMMWWIGLAAQAFTVGVDAAPVGRVRVEAGSVAGTPLPRTQVHLAAALGALRTRLSTLLLVVSAAARHVCQHLPAGTLARRARNLPTRSARGGPVLLSDLAFDIRPAGLFAATPSCLSLRRGQRR